MSHQFVVQVPDFPDQLSKRLEVRGAHLDGIKPHLESGRLMLGGASLDEPATAGKTPSMNGSILIVRADSEASVRDFLAADIYTKSGVWDVDKAVITPFKMAVYGKME